MYLPRTFKYRQSGLISPNLVTLDSSLLFQGFACVPYFQCAQSVIRAEVRSVNFNDDDEAGLIEEAKKAKCGAKTESCCRDQYYKNDFAVTQLL